MSRWTSFFCEQETRGLAPEVVADVQGSIGGEGRIKQLKQALVYNLSSSHCVGKDRLETSTAGCAASLKIHLIPLQCRRRRSSSLEPLRWRRFRPPRSSRRCFTWYTWASVESSGGTRRHLKQEDICTLSLKSWMCWWNAPTLWRATQRSWSRQTKVELS